MNQGWWVFPLLFSMALGTGFRRRRLQSGGKVTPRDVVLIMGLAWAVGWLCLGLAAWPGWNAHIHWQDASMGLLVLASVAFGPLGLFLAATWLPRLFAPDGKKPAALHPLE